MGVQLGPLAAFPFAGGLLVAAFFVFARVRGDYEARGALSRPVAILQTGFFFLYALSSYLFLDSRLSTISGHGLVLVLALLLTSLGLLLVLLSMPFLGRRSFGGEVGALHTSGVYKYSRNPQLVGGFLFVVGYALLWPSWAGLLWAGIWLPTSRLMVGGEEAHLRKAFGEEYEEYCRRTPRYLGLPRR